ncbi:MAG: hypothetical protein AAF547_09060 [Actinomycetota bacterium]
MTSPDGAETFPLVGSFLLAHQGGWDEILMVVGPLAVVGSLLWLANKRVSAQLANGEEAEQPPARPDQTRR